MIRIRVQLGRAGVKQRGRKGESGGQAKGEEVEIFTYLRKKSLFTCVLLYCHTVCMVLSSYFIVFDVDFHYCFLKYLL